MIVSKQISEDNAFHAPLTIVFAPNKFYVLCLLNNAALFIVPIEYMTGNPW